MAMRLGKNQMCSRFFSVFAWRSNILINFV